MIGIGFLLAILATMMPINGFVSPNLLLMKSNSVSHFYIKFSSVLHNQTSNLIPIIPFDANQSDPNRFHLYDLSIVPNKTSITLDSNDTVVDYTVTAKNNLKGLFAFYLPDCIRMPLAVGLDGSQIDPYLINEITTVHGCTLYPPPIKAQLIDGQSIVPLANTPRPSGVALVFVMTNKYVYMPGDVVLIKGKSYLNATDAKLSLEKNHKIPVITKYIPINKNGTFYANFTIPFDTTARSWRLATTVGGGTLSQDIHFKSDSIPPLDQFWSGILTNDTFCKPNLTLIFKTEDKTPGMR